VSRCTLVRKMILVLLIVFRAQAEERKVILPNPNSNDIPYYQMQPLHPFDDSWSLLNKFDTTVMLLCNRWYLCSNSLCVDMWNTREMVDKIKSNMVRFKTIETQVVSECRYMNMCQTDFGNCDAHHRTTHIQLDVTKLDYEHFSPVSNRLNLFWCLQ